MKITILGAGVTGLTLARLLLQDGHDVLVLESSGEAGGLCRSSVVDGFTFDHAGGHILFSKDRATLDWMKERAGSDSLVETERRTRILWHDRYVPYPFENGIASLTPQAKFECLKGYLEAVERRKGGEPCPEDFHSWILWKMGKGFADHFMIPYNEKIWECDLREMSSLWVAGRVPDAPVDDILKAVSGLETRGYTHQARFFYPRRGGFQALTDGIAEGLGDRLVTGHEVRNLRRRGGGWEVDGDPTDLVVNTIPLPVLAEVFEGLPEEIRLECAELRPISLANVLIGCRSDRGLDPLSWIYLPFEDQGPANRVTFFSNYSPENAPEGHVSFMAEVTYRGTLETGKEWLGDLCRALETCGLFRREDVVVLHPFHSRYAYIDQNLAFPDRIARLRAWFDRSGLLSIGRFGRYEYHNSDQCVQRAFQARAHIARLAETGDDLPLSLPA